MSGDFSDLMQLAQDLESAPATLPKYLGKALGRTSKNVKEAAQKKVRSRKYFKGAASAIDYDLTGVSGAVSSMSSEIGYNRSTGAGKIGNLVELGAPKAPRMMNVRGKGGKWITVPVPGGGYRPLPPGGELQDSLQENEEDFVTGVEAAIDDALREAGL